MRKFGWIFLILMSLAACGPNTEEVPLVLAVGAEPSSKLHNDRGKEFFKAGDYYEAQLRFNQAKTADPYSGEIHFNLALTLHIRGEEERARKHFKLARKYAQDNPEILNSPLLQSYLSQKNEIKKSESD